MNLFAVQWLYIIAGLLIGGWLAQKLPRRSFEGSRTMSERLELGWLLILMGAIGVGGYLRFGGVSFGLPLQFHPDEIPKAQVITRMAESGSLNPHYFLHPTLLLYLTLVVNRCIQFFNVAGSFYETTFFAGRLVSAAAGTLSIYLVYAVGRLLLGTASGVAAAAIFSVFPLHVTVSRYMKEDSLLTFCTLLALYFVLRARETNRKHYGYAAGIAVGLAASTKYSGILSILFLLGLPTTAIPAATACAVIGFIFGTPYSVLSAGEFLAGVTYEKNHALRGHTESISAWSQWWLYHWTRSIQPGVTSVVAVFFTAGAGAMLSARRRKVYLVPLLFLLFYLPAEFVPSKPAPQAERYVTLCLPFVALGVSYIMALLFELKRYVPGVLVLIFSLLIPGLQSLQLFENLSPDTRETAAQWIHEHLPQSSTVILDFQPYSPVLAPEQFIVVNDPYLPVGSYVDIRKLRTLKIDYLILSSLSYDRFFSQPNQSTRERVKYRTIFSRLPLVAEFGNPAGTYGFHNPVIRIYKVRM